MMKKVVDNYKIPISFVTSCSNENTAWFVSNRSNLLLEFNSISMELKVIGKLSSENLFIQHLIGAMAIVAGKLIMAPQQGSEFIVYDIYKKTIRKYPCEIEGSYKFRNAVTLGEKVFFMGARAPLIAEFDVFQETIVYHQEFAKDKRIICNPFWGRGTSQVVGNKIYIPQFDSNNIVSVDLESFEYDFIYVENDNIGYNYTYVYEENLYVFPRYGGVIKKVNLRKKEREDIIDVASELCINSKMLYVAKDNNIYIYDGAIGNAGCLLDLKNLSFKTENRNLQERNSAYDINIVGNILLIAKDDDTIECLDLQSFKNKKVSYLEYEKYCKLVFESGNLVFEGGTDLYAYLNYISKNSNECRDITQNVGPTILKKLCAKKTEKDSNDKTFF